MEAITFSGTSSTLNVDIGEIKVEHAIVVFDIKAPEDSQIEITFYHKSDRPNRIIIRPDGKEQLHEFTALVSEIEAVLMDLDCNPINAKWGFKMEII